MTKNKKMPTTAIRLLNECFAFINWLFTHGGAWSPNEDCDETNIRYSTSEIIYRDEQILSLKKKLETILLDRNVSQKIIVLPEDIERETKGIPCPECNGYCDEVKMSKNEIKQYDCGKGHRCCSKAFTCRICQARVIAKLEAPEMLD